MPQYCVLCSTSSANLHKNGALFKNCQGKQPRRAGSRITTRTTSPQASATAPTAPPPPAPQNSSTSAPPAMLIRGCPPTQGPAWGRVNLGRGWI